MSERPLHQREAADTWGVLIMGASFSRALSVAAVGAMALTGIGAGGVAHAGTATAGGAHAKSATTSGDVPAATAPAGGGDLFQTHFDGSIWHYTTPPFTGWAPLSDNPDSKQFATSDRGAHLYELD